MTRPNVTGKASSALLRTVVTRAATGLLPALVGLHVLGQAAIAQSETQFEHSLPLVISAANPVQQGFVRIINHSNKAGTVEIRAFDDFGQRFGPVTLDLEAKGSVHFNSDDLESGNADKGLSGGVGDGQGDWRLELVTTLEIELLGYVRTTEDGFVTSMHDVLVQGESDALSRAHIQSREQSVAGEPIASHQPGEHRCRGGDRRARRPRGPAGNERASSRCLHGGLAPSAHRSSSRAPGG